MIEWFVLAGGIMAGLSAIVKKVAGPLPWRDVLKFKPKRFISDAAFRSECDLWLRQRVAELPENKWISGSAVAILVEASPPPTRSKLLETIRPVDELKSLIAKRNSDFAKTENIRFGSYFDTVESSPLTEEQRFACVCLDDNLLIVAAAGSGKTATMVAKAGYLLNAGLAEPSEILMLAFNRDAADELGDRVVRRLNDVPGVAAIRAQTYSAFGLHVIATVTGKKPSLAPWLAGGGMDIDTILDIVETISSEDECFKADWDMFRTVFATDLGTVDEPGPPDAYLDGRKGYRTANGEVVKSKEERAIANFLFYQGVNYLYEKPYEHDTATVEYRQYAPDFYYPEAGLYHEHFALNADGTSPFGQMYQDAILWKRDLHLEKGTPLFETTSHGLRRGDDLRRLQDVLRAHGVTFNPDPNRKGAGPKPMADKDLARMIRVFQQHVKNNGLSFHSLKKNADDLSDGGYEDRLFRFLYLYSKVSEEWERRLVEGGYVDFEDMLVQATELIEEGKFQSPYAVILSDEFQDCSQARVRLLKALVKAAPRSSHLCVVGDDWQGINRFAGSDISVMTEFAKSFPHASQLALTKTFRCPPAICNVSSEFVQVNPAQIKKAVTTTNEIAGNALKAYGFQAADAAPAFIFDQLRRLYAWIADGTVIPSRGGRVTVMILGRYRADRPADFDAWVRRFGLLIDLSFRTVHASKGLEAEYVFILNLVEGKRGFPSQAEDDPILQIAMPRPERFPMAEERRLFYVALTRASKQVRMFTSLRHPSRFVIELVSSGVVDVAGIDGDAIEGCPACRQGILSLKEGKFGKFHGCTLFPACDYTRSLS